MFVLKKGPSGLLKFLLFFSFLFIGCQDTPSENRPETLREIPGEVDDLVSDSIPAFEPITTDRDYSEDFPGLEGVPISFNVAALIFTADTTVGTANSLLAGINAEIIGGIPGFSTDVPGILILRLPTRNHLEMIELILRLEADPNVEMMVQDILSTEDLTTGTTSQTPTLWAWESHPLGGNWGYELIRVPQMWNFNQAIKKAKKTVEVGVIDSGFAETHPDLVYAHRHGAKVYKNHGTHVAGTIAATFDNGVGIDGISPFARLTVQAPPETGQYSGSGSFSIAYHLREMIHSRRDIAVINISMGIGWEENTDTNTNTEAQKIANNQGKTIATLMRSLEKSGQLPVVVVSAGNDSKRRASPQFIQQAIYNSGTANAALNWNVANIIVVEAMTTTMGYADFSNSNGHIAAPGTGIMSTLAAPDPAGTTVIIGDGCYDRFNGTSMATPHVAGIVSYLYTLDPNLARPTVTTNPALDAINASAVTTKHGLKRIDAWGTVMALDGDHIPRMLLDIDDGTPDGNQRADQAGTDVTDEDSDGDGGVGDGEIDMSDFRRFRDWLLQIEGSASLQLDGSASHPKRDINGNGSVETPADENIYPRADFNGDGVLHRIKAVHGKTDLEVLQDFFDDPHYSKAALDDLLDSGDLSISYSKCFESSETSKVVAYFRKAGSIHYRPDQYRETLSGDNHLQVFTLPMNPSGYAVKVVAFDASGNALSASEQTFPVSLGGDTFWQPECEDEPIEQTCGPVLFNLPLEVRVVSEMIVGEGDEGDYGRPGIGQRGDALFWSRFWGDTVGHFYLEEQFWAYVVPYEELFSGADEILSPAGGLDTVAFVADDNRIAFTGHALSVDDPSVRRGAVFIYEEESIAVVADENQPDPNGNPWEEFEQVWMNSGGDVVFLSGQALWFAELGVPPQKVVAPGDTDPGSGLTFENVELWLVQESGQVLFYAWGDEPSARGIFAWNGGYVSEVARLDAPAQGYPGATYDSIAGLAAGPDGTVLFRATLLLPGDNYADVVYTFKTLDPEVVWDTDSRPGFYPGANVYPMNSFVTSDGRIGFGAELVRAETEDYWSGAFVQQGSDIVLIAEEGQEAPGLEGYVFDDLSAWAHYYPAGPSRLFIRAFVYDPIGGGEPLSGIWRYENEELTLEFTTDRPVTLSDGEERTVTSIQLIQDFERSGYEQMAATNINGDLAMLVLYDDDDPFSRGIWVIGGCGQ